MTSFVLAAAALTLAVLAILGLPLLRRPHAPRVDRGRLNARLLREHLAVLEAEFAEGAMDRPAFEQQRDEIARRVLEDADDTGALRALPDHAPATLAGLLLMIPLSAALLYLLLGSPGALTNAAAEPTSGQAAPGGAAPPKSVQDMVSTLAARLNSHPDDPKGWAMLGRSYSVLGRFDDAAAAYARIGPSLQTNPRWLAEYADALAMQAAGNPVGRPEALALSALRLDPNNLLALMLAAYAATRRGDDRAALPLLLRAERRVTPGSDDASFVDQQLQQVQARLGGAQAPGTATASGARQAATPAVVLTVHVNLAPGLRGQAAGRTLYVIARKPGQAMPVAVFKREATRFPLNVSLGDADSMLASSPLSKAGTVEVEARLSASGDAMPARGDDYGVSAPTSGGQVAVTIDRRRP